MWQKFISFIIKFFTGKRQKQLTSLAQDTQDISLCTFKNKITKINNKVLSIDFKKAIQIILDETIPRKYDEALNRNDSLIVLYKHDFSYTNARQILPFLNEQLNIVGIKNARLITDGTAIIIDVDDISKAIESWSKKDNSSEIDETKLHQAGIYR